MKQFLEDFKQAEYLHRFLLRWAIILGTCTFVLLIAIRYQQKMECEELIDMYSNINYNNSSECKKLHSHNDYWGDPYYIKYEFINNKLVVTVYSENGGRATRILRRL